jgi:dihydroorotate dehydrogenase electron transfer subunit
LLVLKIQHSFSVVANEKICLRYYRLALATGAWAKMIKPGQFVHVRVNEGLEPFFRRPFSVARAQKQVEIFYEPVGKGTRFLTHKKPGEILDVLGPLGNHFQLPPAGIKHVVMIAGGIGVAPFLFLSDLLKKKAKYKLTLLYGARSQEQVFDFSPFKKNGCQVFVSTDDGSVGRRGKVSQLFGEVKGDATNTFIYTCGPRPMMKAVQDFAADKGFRGQASCEEVMACGVGACLGCVIKTTAGYKTVCDDGPVFDLAEIVF